MKKKRLSLSYPKLLIFGFGGIIILGALLLCFPVSSATGEWTSPLDALFTATSATCVTGLIVADTFTHWSLFGQIVIISLIQVGGLGFMTLISLFALLLKKRISLRDRLLLVQSSGSMKLQGLGNMIRRIVAGTFLIEGIGAVVLSFRFISQFGIARGIYYSIFHSVSAFCNAGFDLMGVNAPFSSLTDYVGDPLVCITIMLLIVIGGIGFLVWSDICQYKLRFSRYSLHSKIVLTTTLILLAGGGILFYFIEQNTALANLSGGEKILAAAFQSVTLRTAGFNTIDQAALSDAGVILSVVLMLIGGSPGSTAGGVKTATVAVVLLSAISVCRNHRQVEVFKRQLPAGIIRQSFAVVFIYITALLGGCILLSFTEAASLSALFFEVGSALGTVGVTMGITTSLTAFGKTAVLLMMFFGRIGGLSMVMAFSEEKTPPPLQRPEESLLIG